MIEPRNVTARGADVVNRAEGKSACAVVAWRTTPPGSKSTACSQGFTQEPGRPCRLRRRVPVGSRATKTQARRRAVLSHLWERKDERHCGTAKRRKRSAAGGTSGSHSASLYRRSGGTDPRDPVEGRGRRRMEPMERKMTETPISEKVLTKLQRIAQLARESPRVPGPEGARRLLTLA